MSSSSSSSAPIIALAGAAVGAVVTQIFNYVVQRLLHQRSEADLRARLVAEQKREQLTKLYGPLELLTRHASQLQLTLNPSDDPTWRFIEHITGIMESSVTAPIALEIVEVNQRIEATMVEGAGLVIGKHVPESFVQFLKHARVVQAAVESRRTPEFSQTHYPHRLDDEVAAACQRLREELGVV